MFNSLFLSLSKPYYFHITTTPWILICSKAILKTYQNSSKTIQELIPNYSRAKQLLHIFCKTNQKLLKNYSNVKHEIQQNLPTQKLLRVGPNNLGETTPKLLCASNGLWGSWKNFSMCPTVLWPCRKTTPELPKTLLCPAGRRGGATDVCGWVQGEISERVGCLLRGRKNERQEGMREESG